ncbi:hypothetical protein [uncultured Ruegeria sp.]|uniref:hypothetical protein n=1 Tax=uncultured Ruegeria sp. TaxID=259304 RepID=UPI00262CD209|nr:hypothetical protein [uncultured Ruegeria sp.]
MIWKTNTHKFSATICQRTGKNCPALARMARALASSMAKADPKTTERFEIEGSCDLTHCPNGCTARFRARPDEIRVYCDVDSDAKIEHLDGYADLLFGTDACAIPAGTLSRPPCAMLEALALSKRTRPQTEFRPSV